MFSLLSFFLCFSSFLLLFLASRLLSQFRCLRRTFFCRSSKTGDAEGNEFISVLWLRVSLQSTCSPLCHTRARAPRRCAGSPINPRLRLLLHGYSSLLPFGLTYKVGWMYIPHRAQTITSKCFEYKCRLCHDKMRISKQSESKFDVTLLKITSAKLKEEAKNNWNTIDA